MGVTVKPELVVTRKGGQKLILTEGDKVDRSLVVTFKDGVQLVLDEEDKVEVENTLITLVCDSPRCAARRNQEEPNTLFIDDEKAKADPLTVPDDFWHGIKAMVDPRQDVAVWFCSAGCCKDYLTYSYIPPATPRALIAANTKPTLQSEDKLRALIDAANKHGEE